MFRPQEHLKLLYIAQPRLLISSWTSIRLPREISDSAIQSRRVESDVAMMYFRRRSRSDNQLSVTAERCEDLGVADLSMIQDAPVQVTDARLLEAIGAERARCRVRGYISPQVGFELQLSAADWNGKFIEVGCGGFCGHIDDWMNTSPYCGTRDETAGIGIQERCLRRGGRIAF